MLRILRSIAQDLEKVQDKKILCIYSINMNLTKLFMTIQVIKIMLLRKTMTIYASLVNVTPPKENIDWPSTSTLTSHDHQFRSTA